MDVGFHYYIIYLLCTGLGMEPDHAEKVAYASQHVDDNNGLTFIDKHRPTELPLLPTFSIDVLETLASNGDLSRLTMLNHFAPGDGPDATHERRADGQWTWGITTPGCKVATNALEAAIATGNLRLIGSSLHTYADTFAHTNFCGYNNSLNKLPGSKPPYNALDLGHGSAGHNPDWPGYWTDTRMKETTDPRIDEKKRKTRKKIVEISRGCRIDNKVRFQTAATEIAKKLDPWINPGSKKNESQTRISSVVDKVFKAFGEPLDLANTDTKTANFVAGQQIEAFVALSKTPEFGGREMVRYNSSLWYSETPQEGVPVSVHVRGFKDSILKRLTMGLLTESLFEDRLSWNVSESVASQQKTFESDRKDRAESRKGFRYFGDYNLLNDPEVVQTWSPKAQAVAQTDCFKWHVASQTHHSYLIDQTSKITFETEEGKVVPLIKLYDHGKQEKDATSLLERTENLRQTIYKPFHRKITSEGEIYDF